MRSLHPAIVYITEGIADVQRRNCVAWVVSMSWTISLAVDSALRAMELKAELVQAVADLKTIRDVTEKDLQLSQLLEPEIQ